MGGQPTETYSCSQKIGGVREKDHIRNISDYKLNLICKKFSYCCQDLDITIQ